MHIKYALQYSRRKRERERGCTLGCSILDYGESDLLHVRIARGKQRSHEIHDSPLILLIWGGMIRGNRQSLRYKKKKEERSSRTVLLYDTQGCERGDGEIGISGLRNEVYECLEPTREPNDVAVLLFRRPGAVAEAGKQHRYDMLHLRF